MSRASRARYPNAFTLAELLVALTISSVIMLAVVGSFRAGLRVWRHVEDDRPLQEQAHAILRMLRLELAGLYLPAVPEGAEPPFLRQDNRIVFFTTNPAGRARPGQARCARVAYELQDRRLVRRETTVAAGTPIAEPCSEVLAAGLTSVSFTDPGQAHRPADAPTGPPRLLQVSLRWPRTAVSAQLIVPVQTPLHAQG